MELCSRRLLFLAPMQMRWREQKIGGEKKLCKCNCSLSLYLILVHSFIYPHQFFLVPLPPPAQHDVAKKVNYDKVFFTKSSRGWAFFPQWGRRAFLWERLRNCKPNFPFVMRASGAPTSTQMKHQPCPNWKSSCFLQKTEKNASEATFLATRLDVVKVEVTSGQPEKICFLHF